MDYAKFDNADPTPRNERGSNLTHAGEHEFEIVDVRENVGGTNTPGGYGFFIDLVVLSGPTEKGHLFTKKWFPFAPPKSSPTTGKTIPQSKKTENDLGAMKRWLAAGYGIDPTDVAAVKAGVNQKVLQGSVSNAEHKSPLIGKRVKGKAKPYNQTTFVDDIFPSDFSTRDTIPGEVTQVKAVATFPPEGWTAHPAAPGYFYRGQEVLSEADLRKQA